MPSEKNSWSLSADMLRNGSTATETLPASATSCEAVSDRRDRA